MESFKYNPQSSVADEFICHDEILASLQFAEAHKNDEALLAQILAKAKEEKEL